jgi:hypothetical protein
LKRLVKIAITSQYLQLPSTEAKVPQNQVNRLDKILNFGLQLFVIEYPTQRLLKGSFEAFVHFQINRGGCLRFINS